MDNPPSLAKLIGDKIVGRFDAVDDEKASVVKLLSVENAGIWIESEKIVEDFLSSHGVSAAPRTVIVFVPWHRVQWILDVADYPSLSEKGFGL